MPHVLMNCDMFTVFRITEKAKLTLNFRTILPTLIQELLDFNGIVQIATVFGLRDFSYVLFFISFALLYFKEIVW